MSAQKLNSRIYMDFVPNRRPAGGAVSSAAPRRPAAPARPAARPTTPVNSGAISTTSRPHTTHPAVVKNTTKPAASKAPLHAAATTSAVKAARSAAISARRPLGARRAPVASKPAARPAAKSAAAVPKLSKATKAAAKPAAARSAKPADFPELKVVGKIATPEPAAKPKGSRLAALIKGDKAAAPAEVSPFLTSVNVDKRPLSGHSKAATSKPSSEAKILSLKETPARPKNPALVTSAPKAKSKLPLVILILITIVLGAAVGAAAYFLFFHEY